MKPTRVALALLVALAVLVATACGGNDQSVPADAVAVVDGTPITKADLDALLARTKKSRTVQKQNFPKAGTAEYQALQTQAVAFLVQRAEFDNRADDLKITVTDKEIDARIAEIKKQSFGGSQAKLDKQLKAQGITTKDLRDDVKARLLSEKLYTEITKEREGHGCPGRAVLQAEQEPVRDPGQPRRSSHPRQDEGAGRQDLQSDQGRRPASRHWPRSTRSTRPRRPTAAR